MPTFEVQQKFISILVQFKEYANFCQLLFSGQVEFCLLYVTVSGKRSVLDVLILFSNSFLGTEIGRLICVVVSVLPTLDLTTFEQQVCSTTIGYANALSLETNSSKKKNLATLNNAYQAKKSSANLTVAGLKDNRVVICLMFEQS